MEKMWKGNYRGHDETGMAHNQPVRKKNKYRKTPTRQRERYLHAKEHYYSISHHSLASPLPFAPAALRSKGYLVAGWLRHPATRYPLLGVGCGRTLTPKHHIILPRANLPAEKGKIDVPTGTRECLLIDIQISEVEDRQLPPVKRG
ncbi:hypothetical protein Krac_1270 [Ktedonobacter racemifer DSM 44963]|uniref:Uncharacterized protein n=2 Tax=Ktedonobacter racemifer TaxID=363277 RepID=D6U6P3_KTERA|nr:hypothetical protein Krac_1270 [Ktedonobacter racemifer DSM 44963]